MRKSQEKLIDYVKFPGSQTNKGPGAHGEGTDWDADICTFGVKDAQEERKQENLTFKTIEENWKQEEREHHGKTKPSGQLRLDYERLVVPRGIHFYLLKAQ